MSLAGMWFATVAMAGEWREFRGPDGTGIAETTGLPLEWDESRHVLWKIAVPGLGFSSPVIADGRVWLTTALDSKQSPRGPPSSITTNSPIWAVA